jgi:S-DNA-T family DNA segregation ATPase FtsK/SpoIIIE
MSITNKIITNLFEDDKLDADEVAQHLYDKYYDKNKHEFTIDISQEVNKICNDTPKYIDQVNNCLDSLINSEDTKEEADLSPELKETGDKISKILNNYGVKATLVNAKVGPRVTQYEYELAPGTKISEVSNLNKEISMGLAVSQVNIGPVEGSTTLGIQVPNKESSNVSLDDVMKTSDKSGISMALGKDTNGNSVSADILKLQHILIGGTTGSGKSACINTMICSLIQQYSPDQVKLILIDPKKVELSAYKSIPHLLIPIVTDTNKAVEVLNELVSTMDKRYNDFEKVGVKNIESYNNLVDKYNSTGKSAKIMPYIICIIDELADLMQTSGKEVESSIQRLTQLARAAGIHLIVATQRPSVDVVTGVIKSNINSRIAFATPSNVDSRTILDQGGAEKLLGKGDMLYKPLGASNAKRVQGAFVSDDEVDKIVKEVDNKYKSNTPDESRDNPETSGETKDTKDNDLYSEVVSFTRKNKRISASMLQLKFHLSYSEASKYIDRMEEEGIIKSQKGNRQRRVR